MVKFEQTSTPGQGKINIQLGHIGNLRLSGVTPTLIRYIF
ncbi:conserved protein of unknown function [Limnospira indica PCC 8005]|uniref:Uncharacterized protein n=1 Tax=Limnospira indica PCC 8005 TaxID=376219 RepID=A0A9P1P0Y9_9CYAN|nr:conserved protein of unknown function [Limnospira indica PCC 8005]